MPLVVTRDRYSPRWAAKQWADNRALIVFGDNFARKGTAGQAVIRREPNAVGIATKRAPTMRPDAFLTDADLPEWRSYVSPDMYRLANYIRRGGLVLWPEDGIGTGLARLQVHAPAILNEVNAVREWLASGAVQPFVNYERDRRPG